jgi:hypothetical protein
VFIYKYYENSAPLIVSILSSVVPLISINLTGGYSFNDSSISDESPL